MMELTKGGFSMKGSFDELQWERNSKKLKKDSKNTAALASSAEIPDKLLLTVKGTDGRFYTQDIYTKVLEQTGKEKITSNLYQRVHDELDYATFEINEKTGDIDWGFEL